MIAACSSAGYDEVTLRREFLNRLFRTLNWDIGNKAGPTL